MPLLQTVGNQPEQYQDAHLYLDFQRKTATLDLERLRLTRKEYELLALLVQNAGEIVAREDLLQRVWGYSDQIRTRTLDVHIRRLRKKARPICGALHRDDFRHRLSFSAVSRPCSCPVRWRRPTRWERNRPEVSPPVR